MPGARTPLRPTLAALTVLLIAAVSLPVAAYAQHNEYDLNLPGAGNSGQTNSGGGGSNSGGGSTSTSPSTPTAPSVTSPTTPTSPTGTETVTGDDAAGVAANDGKKRNRKGNRKREADTAPALTTSAVNATAGPRKTPPLRLPDDGGGVPTLAIAIVTLAAALCVLALWRMRYMRELPGAPRPRPTSGSASS
mgnify:CR=1 FL=1